MGLVELVLLSAATLGMLLLIGLRLRSNDTVPETRLLLVDLILLAAVLEALLDTLHDLTGIAEFFTISAAGRGAVAIGVLALVLSYRRGK